MHTFFIIIIVLLAVFTAPKTWSAKKHCQPYFKKLQIIQVKQRQGHSAKQAITLAKKNKAAWQKWQDCESGKIKIKNTQKKAQKAKKINNSTKISRIKKIKSTKAALTLNNQKEIIPFKTSKAIVIKSKYRGEKLQAWLRFYKMPKQCNRPKKTSVFVYCVENKQKQRSAFEKQFNADRLEQ